MKLKDLILTTNRGGLPFPELLREIQEGTRIELQRLLPYQRPAVVTTLAILLHLMRRYPGKDIGAMPLLTPPDEPAWLQPALSETNADLGLDDLDLPIMAINHEAKTRLSGDLEAWVFALMGSTWKLPRLKWWGTTGREFNTVVLTSADGTLGSEVRALAEAYAKHTPQIAGTKAQPKTFEDHLLYAQQWINEQSVDKVPYPALIQRGVHLTDGGCVGLSGKTLKRRITAGQHLEDPHIPTLAGSPLALVGARVFDARFQQACLFGAATYGSKDELAQRATILDLTEYRFVRLCAFGKDQAKTLGFWESTYIARPQPAGFSLSLPDRATDLSTRVLAASSEATSVLNKGLVWLLGVMKEDKPEMSDHEWLIAGRYKNHFQRAIEHDITQLVFDLLGAQPDPAAEQQAIHSLLTRHLRDVFAQAETAVFDELHKARARNRFETELKKLTGGDTLTTELPHLVQQTFAVLRDIRAHLQPDQRAQLRTMNYENPPIGYWALLSKVPAAQANADNTEQVWRAGISALGRVNPSSYSAGRSLADTDLPEMRMQQLLTATGDSLVTQTQEAVRWLVAHEVESVNLSELVALGLADAMGDRECAAWCRKKLAMDYVRSQGRAA